MGCFVVLLAFITPRFAIAMLWLFTDYMTRAFGSGLLATLGFLFLPTTTIAYAIAQNSIHAQLGKTIIVVFGVLVDVGVIGKGRGVAKDRGGSRDRGRER